jgi:uncharacterized membrane protein
MKRFAFLFFLAMVPVIELRGSVPIGLSWGLPFWQVMLVSIIGNCCIIVPVVTLGERVLEAIASWPYVGAFGRKMLDRARRKAESITDALLVGLFLFVAIPLPGTGAWTGSLIAAMMDMKVKDAFPSILLGVVTAGIIISFVTYGAGALLFG